MFSTFCASTHHDATSLELDSMVSHIKKNEISRTEHGFSMT